MIGFFFLKWNRHHTTHRYSLHKKHTKSASYSLHYPVFRIKDTIYAIDESVDASQIKIAYDTKATKIDTDIFFVSKFAYTNASALTEYYTFRKKITLNSISSWGRHKTKLSQVDGTREPCCRTAFSLLGEVLLVAWPLRCGRLTQVPKLLILSDQVAHTHCACVGGGGVIFSGWRFI